MVNARIYAEGGGEGALMDVLFRQAWRSFFLSAGLAGRLPKVIRCGGRQQAYDDFVTAHRNPPPDTIPLLLVDSEAPYSGKEPWTHLKERDGWSKPEGAKNDQVFLMVQLMETWFLADRDLLRRFFGPKLSLTPLKAWPNLEAVAKLTVLEALEQATVACPKRYAKGGVSFELLSRVEANVVVGACPEAEKLIARLKKFPARKP